MTGLSISLFTYFRIHQFPDWFSYFNYILVYGRGAYDIPMPFIGPYYFVILIYIAAFYLLIYKIIVRDFAKFQIILFILFYGILSFFYYLVFSEPHHFLTIVHPSILLSMILLDIFIKKRSLLIKLPLSQAALIVTFGFFIIGYLFWEPVRTWKYALLRFNNRYGPLSQPYNRWNYNGTNLYLSDNNGSDFFKSADTIKSLSGNTKNVVILSRYDTLLYVMTEKTSLTNHPIIEYDVGFIKDREQIINTILTNKPLYVYVFSKNYNTMVSWTIHEIWDAVKTQYSFLKNAGIIDVYKLKNN